MNELPWIVVHGGAVWVAALAGLLAMGAALGAAIALGRVAAEVRGVRRVLGAPVGKGARDDGARVTLEGVLQGGAAASLFPPGRRQRSLASRREGELSLDVGREVIALVGNPPVLAGSVEVGPRPFTRLPWQLREPMVHDSPEAREIAAEDRIVALHAIEAGDPVRVGGVLRRVASPAEGKGYRRAAAAWTLAVEDGAEGHGLAYAGLPPLAARARRSAAAGAAVGLALFGLVFVAGGAAAHRLEIFELAAAAPFHREAALETMQRRLRLLPHHHPYFIEKEAGLARLRDAPLEAQEVLLRHRHLRSAAAPGAGGPSRRALMAQARALVELGEWAEASDALEKARGDQADVATAIVHLLAGRPLLAVRTLRYASTWSAPGGSTVPVAEWTLTATADAIEARATGNIVARMHVNLLAGEHPDDRALHYLVADLLEDEARRKHLVHHANRGAPARAAMSLERLLAREAGDASGRDWDRLVYPVWLAYGREEGHLWELLPALFEPEASLLAEPHARTEAAFVLSSIGDHARAAALLPPPVPGASYTRVDDPALLGTIVERRSRALDPMPAGHDTWLARPIEEWTHTTLDGRRLAAILDENPLDGDQAYLAGRLAQTHREELSAWLRHGVYEHRSKTRLGRLAELVNLCLLAESLGDEEAAVELRAVVQRHRKALLRRDILVPLAILEELVLDGAASPDFSP